MPWYDCAFVDWEDCIWQDWDDCEWDKFSIVYQDPKTRTMRSQQFAPEGAGNLRRPYLEGNPSYVEDNLRYPDVAIANARIMKSGEVRPHMTFKQPYQYDQFQKMKYRDEPPFPHHETISAQNIVETPADILDEEPPKKDGDGDGGGWGWINYFDDTRWGSDPPGLGGWFDDHWLETICGFFLWDYNRSVDTIDAGEELAIVATTRTLGPYTWTVEPSDKFSLNLAQTQTEVNFLSATEDACGTAIIEVTDRCSESNVIGYVRCTTGQWVRIVDCGFGNAGGCCVDVGRIRHCTYYGEGQALFCGEEPRCAEQWIEWRNECFGAVLYCCRSNNRIGSFVNDVCSFLDSIQRYIEDEWQC